MAVLKAKEIREMSPKDLKEKVTDINKELMKLRSQVSSGAVPESPGKIKALRRTIARIKTIEKEVVNTKHE